MPDAAASASQEDKEEEAKAAVQAGKPSAQGVARWTGENLIHPTSWKENSRKSDFTDLHLYAVGARKLPISTVLSILVNTRYGVPA
jgi:hypothetical protein